MKSDVGRPGFFSSGDTKPVFHTNGNRPTANDRFSMSLIILENSESHALKTNVCNKSSGDVLAGADLMRGSTSAGVVGTSDVRNHVGVTGSGTLN